MKTKKWWKILFPLVIAVKVVVVLMILESAKSDSGIRPMMYESVYLPETVSFAGEPMPIERFDVREALDRELLSNAYFHSQTIRYIKLAPRYFAMIEPILKEEGIPDDFKYLALAESGFNPRAVSPARAVGLWQFLKGTAKDYGLEVNDEVDERYHIEKSTRAACRYLKDAYEKFGSWALVAAAYNCGPDGIKKQIERQKEDSYYDLLVTTETARYVYRIVALKLILSNPEKYHFYIDDAEKYPLIPVKEVKITTAVPDLADFAQQHGINYKLLKDFNPWLRDNMLTNPNGKTYVVKIPQLKNGK